MKIIYKGRGQGKTAELIKLASESNAYIIVTNRQRALSVSKMAQDMGLNILFPVTVEEYMRSKLVGSHVNKCLLDDVDQILQQLFYTVQIDAITLTKQDLDNLS